MSYLEENLKQQLEMHLLKEDILKNKDAYSYLSAEKQLDLLREIDETIEKLDESACNFLTESTTIGNFQLLQEINIRRLDKVTQRRLAAIRIAIGLAKAANDPLYAKYAKGVMLRKTYKEYILHKYGNKAYQMALARENENR